MNHVRRRLMLAGLLAILPLRLRSAAAAHVVIVGGGFGGASCARVLRDLAPDIAVTLIEPRALFHTGVFSNSAVASLCALGDIVRGPATLQARGLKWMRETAVEIDPVLRKVRLSSGATLRADFLVVSPGVEMRWDTIDGLNARSSEHMPHAWLGDAQVPRLRQRLEAIRDGATLLVSAPANPYRCPPGPYERASLMAWRLAATQRRCKIIVADAKDDFSKRALFKLGWDTLYPGTVEWVSRASGGEVIAVDAAKGKVHLASGDVIHTDLASIIPPQHAATIARDAGLTDESGWCPVRPLNMESRLHNGVHVIGDAAAADPMPKSAFCANSQAKQVALSIAAKVRGDAPPAPTYLNTCYSLMAPDYAISVGNVFAIQGEHFTSLSSGTSALSGGRELRAREARYAQQLYHQITRDSFAS